MSEAILDGNNVLINLLCQVSILNIHNINIIIIKYLFLKSRYICVFLLRGFNFHSIGIINSVESYDLHSRFLDLRFSLNFPDARETEALLYGTTETAWRNIVRQQNRTCYECGYSQQEGDCVYRSTNGQVQCFREIPIPNYMSTNYICDPTPNPTRIVVDVSHSHLNCQYQTHVHLYSQYFVILCEKPWFFISSTSAGLRTCIPVWHRAFQVGCPL